MHLRDELLSAYLDGELDPTEALAAAAHLRSCAGCAETARLYAALDLRLTAIPALACASARTLISAQLDGELDGEESDLAAAHLAGCGSCREDVLRWSVADQAIARLPAARPSARVDAAVAALGREPARRGLPRIAWPVPALAVATALSLVIVLSLSLEPVGPVGQNVALVAAVQQSVLNPQTGILYVLHPENGTVAALDAQDPRSTLAVITVGGRPTALALNQTTNTILVLDATAKTVTEIDGAKNTVTGSTAVAVPGTPTSLQVAPNGDVVVTAVVASASGPSAAPAKSGGAAGVVAVFNGETKRLESVKTVDVAPQVIVLEPNGRRALLVSLAATTLVDATTYQPLTSKAGGVAAAFASTGDDFAILSAGPNGAVVSFARRTGSPLFVGGNPHAIAALPDGGFAVLADLNDRGVVTLIAPDGSISATLDVPARARDLAYDAATRQFAVIAPAGVTNVSLPAAVIQQSQPPVQQPAAGTALPTPKATPQASATPTPAPTEPVAAVAPRAIDGLVPTSGREVWAGTYLVTVGAAERPERAVGDGSHIWYVDSSNRVTALNMATGQRFQIRALPAAANIGRIAVSPDHVYLIDSIAGVVYSLTIHSEQLATIPMPFAKVALSATASADERLWLGTAGAGLIGYDPRTGKIETIPAGPNLTALASDPLGRIWIAARERQALNRYDPLSSELLDVTFTHGGSISALVVDRAGTLWIGTDSGQAFAIRNSSLLLDRGVGRAIDDLTLDQNGVAYAISRDAAGLRYGRADGSGAQRQAPAGSSGPIFDQLGRVWQADRSASGFYVTLPEGRP